jgi:hypothetical protein
VATRKGKNVATRNRLLMLIGIGLGGSILVISLGIFVIYNLKIKDAAAEAAIVGGVLTFLGTSYTALYNEISSYYKDRANNIEKKWNLIYPVVKEIYMPWIVSATALYHAISALSPPKITTQEALHILYLTCLFYGNRLRFITGDAGGTVILSTTREEDKVSNAYYKISTNFEWAGSSAETTVRVSELQYLFISKDKKDNPYIQFRFAHDVEETESLKKRMDELEQWLKIENNKQKVEKALHDFIDTFQEQIGRVYDAWET